MKRTVPLPTSGFPASRSRLRSSLAGMALCLAGLAPTSGAGAAAPSAAPAAETAAQAAAQAAPLQAAPQTARATVAPHRAAYRLSLHSARNGSKVTDVRGSMTFEWADACDGWTTEQRYELRFVYAEGESMELVTSSATWEAKDGSAYRFNVRRTVDGDVDGEVRGDARLANAERAGTVTYTRPDAREEALPRGTLFPSAHTLALLEKAQAGEKFFSRVMFDGTDDKGPVQVSAVIAAPRSFEEGPVSSSLLAEHRAWPVRLAFFPTNSQSPQPDYEMTIDLLRNGVARGMRIDYGDFIVDAILENVEAIAGSGC